MTIEPRPKAMTANAIRSPSGDSFGSAMTRPRAHIAAVMETTDETLMGR
jgi:hypothetical protein